MLKRALLAVGLAVGLTVVLHGGTASAEWCPAARSYCNNAEAAALHECWRDYGRISGAIWFNNTGDAPTNNGGYYTGEVRVSGDDGQVAINIRGSAFACGSTSTSPVYAVQIAAQGENAWRLTNVQGTLYRGNMQGSPSAWSTQGNSVTAVLNTTGLATNNATQDDSQTIMIELRRCFSTDGVNPAGSCYPTSIPITVVRQKRAEFDLVPSVSIDKTVVEQGTPYVIQPQIDNTRGSGSPADSHWVLERQENGGAWSKLAEGKQAFPAGVSAINHSANQRTGEDVSTGGRVCYRLSIAPQSHQSSARRESAPACVSFAKRPKVQVWGGDVSVGRRFEGAPAVSGRQGINTSITTKSSDGQTRTYGSWGEYGVSASGRISGMASSSGLSGGHDSNAQAGWSHLTFANRPVVGTPCVGTAAFGCYNTAEALGTVPSIDAFMTPSGQTQPIGDSLSLDGQPAGRRVLSRSGNLTITGGTIGPGRSIVIKTTGAVTIRGSIRYDAKAVSQVTDLPQVVVVARSIRIAPEVDRVDAWLYAKPQGLVGGVLDTCAISDVATTSLSSKQCDKSLTINGPVSARSIWLRRTAGSGSGARSGDPAEVINLRADARLWLHAQAQSSSRAQTVSTKELPVRF